MQKVVHLFYIFTTIFYFNFFRSGKSFLYWLKFELIKNLLNHVNRIQIHSNCPALCFGTPLVSAPSSPAPLPLMLPDHARLHRGRVWLSIGPPPPTPSSTRHPQARPPPQWLSPPRPLQKGLSARRHPLFPPHVTSSPTGPRTKPPPLPLCLLSTPVPEAAIVPPILEPLCPLIPFSRELLPLEPPITDWLAPLRPLHSLRLSEHLVVVVDHHSSPERRHHNPTSLSNALLHLTDDRVPR
jgi:hypothetical protein